MILITGGAWQGKREYAYGLIGEDSEKKLIIEGGRCTAENMKTVKIIDQLHVWIRRQMEEMMPQAGRGAGASTAGEGWDELVFDQQEMLICQQKIEETIQEVLAENPDVIIIVNELGCGVIPMEAFERRYRELVGRICCELAKEAREVHRVVCGIGTVLKASAADAVCDANQADGAGVGDATCEAEAEQEA